MNRVGPVWILVLLLGCGEPAPLTPEQFTQEFVKGLGRTAPEVKVEVLGELELRLIFPDGRESTSFLENAYRQYRQEPAAKKTVIERYARAAFETPEALRLGVIKTNIVPVVKDRLWLQETRSSLLDRDATAGPDPVYDDLNTSLVILYAEDNPRLIRYLTPKDLEDHALHHAELRALAVENLQRLLPKIERHGTNGVYFVTAGGDYEASLLLLDSLWTDGLLKVQGDYVVAIPARGMLMVTGTENSTGLRLMRETVDQAVRDKAYPMTPSLFVYRGGTFVEFESPSRREP